MEGLYFGSGIDQDFVKDINKMLASVDKLKNKTANATSNMEDSFSKLQKRAMQVFSGIALTSFIKQTIEVRNEIENLTAAFTVMLQSKEKANQLMKDIVTTAATTPFSITDLAGASKQLLAFGQDSENVVSTLRRLGDVASASGQNIGDITAIYGKSLSKQKVGLEELNMWTEKGIPILAELAKQYDTNTAGIYKMVLGGKIGFSDLQQSIFNLTAEGGKFYGMMQTQSATVAGMMSNLGDQYDQMLNSIGQASTPVITTTIKLLSTLLDHWEEIATAIGIAVVAYGSYKAVVMSMAAFNEAKLIMQAVSSLGILSASLGTATVAQEGLNIAMMANPIGLVVAGVAALVAGLYLLGDWSSDQEKNLKRLAKQAEDSNKEIAKSFEKLRDKLNKSNLSENEILAIKKEMILLYPKELKYLEDQKVTSAQLADIWEGIKKTHMDIGTLEINNKAIKDYEAQLKHLEDISKGLVKDDFTDVWSFGGKEINGVQVSQQVLDQYDIIKAAINDLQIKNQELQKGVADAGEEEARRIAEENAKRIADLQKTNELEYQLKVNNANKLYGADVSNSMKLKDALYRIELNYIDKQLSAIDEQNKGKITKELELQKAQLNAKKIGLNNQYKLDLEAKIKKDNLDNISNKYAFVEKLNTIEKNRAQYTSGVAGYTVTAGTESGLYKQEFKESLLKNEADILETEMRFEKNLLELKKQQLQEELAVYKLLKDKSEEDLKKIINLKEELKINEAITKDLYERGQYTSKLLNNNKTIAQLQEDRADLLRYNETTFKSDVVDNEMKAIHELRTKYNKLKLEKSQLNEIINLPITQKIEGNIELINEQIEAKKRLKIVNDELADSLDHFTTSKLSQETYAYINLIKNQEDETSRFSENLIEGMLSTSISIKNLSDDLSDLDKQLTKTIKTGNKNDINDVIDEQIYQIEGRLSYAKSRVEEYQELLFLSREINFGNIELVTADVQGMTGNEYQEEIKKIEILNEELEKLRKTKIEIKLENIEKTAKELETITSNLVDMIEMFKTVDDSGFNNLSSSILQVSGDLLKLTDIVINATQAVGTLAKAGFIIAGIAQVMKIMYVFDEMNKKEIARKDKALSSELQYNYAITEERIKQLALYEQGSEFYSSDKFGETIKGLSAYNEALRNQNDILLEIKENSGVTEYDKGLFKAPNFLTSEEQVRGRAKESALDQVGTTRQALASVEVKTKERSKFGSSLGLKDEYSDILSMYPLVVDGLDKINYTILENIVANEDLNDSDKQRLQNLIDNNKVMLESYKKFGDYISGIFGGVGESVTSSFQTAYESTKNFSVAGEEAMRALEQSFSDMIESFTRDAIENAILQPLIEQLNSVNKALGETYAKSNKSSADTAQLQNGILNSLGTFYQQVNGAQGVILDTFKQADELAKQAGFDSAFNSGDTSASASSIADTSGSGNIVGASITQEVSNELLARVNGIYLNTEHMLKLQNDASEYAIRANLYLSNISSNSNYLVSIDERLKKMNDKL